ncbi:hypothetical protein N9060_01655 [Arenicella sp.]|nr:hypothetical protein [Arenicella sp.]
MKTRAKLSWVVLIGAFMPPLAMLADLPSGKSNLSREPGAVYMEDFLDEEVKLKVTGDYQIFRSLEGKKPYGRMKTGEAAILLAMSDKAFRVRTKAQHGQVAGWASIKAFQGPDEDFIANLRKSYERFKVVQELIDKGQVALGMTIDEVTRVLGKPTEKTTRLDKGGRADVFEYVNFKRVPQYRYVPDAYGRMIKQTYYVQVETGRTTVTFKNEVADSIEDKESDPVTGNGAVKIVPLPIELY